MPDLIVVDGNNIQKNAAETVLTSLGIAITVVAVVKDDRHRASRILASEDTLKKHKFDILLANAEAHRFAVGYYRNLSRRTALNSKRI